MGLLVLFVQESMILAGIAVQDMKTNRLKLQQSPFRSISAHPQPLDTIRSSQPQPKALTSTVHITPYYQTSRRCS